MNLREEIARLQAELDALPYSGELLAHKWQRLAELQRLRADLAEYRLYTILDRHHLWGTPEMPAADAPR